MLEKSIRYIFFLLAVVNHTIVWAHDKMPPLGLHYCYVISSLLSIILLILIIILLFIK